MNFAFWCLIFVACSLLIVNHHVQAATGSIIPIPVRCHQKSSKKCVIETFSLSDPSHEVNLPDLNGKNTLQIKRGNLTDFSENLASQLGTVEKLNLGSLLLKKIFLKPQLLELTASGNQIDAVKFPAEDLQFKLQVLDLSSNRLTDLTGFEVLLNLHELHLEDNALDSVDLKVFKGMQLLEKLYLDRNKITTLDATESFELPVLEYFSLSGNHIAKIDVTSWQLDSLTQWEVSANKLVQIDGNLEEQFPSLQMISVAKNEWHCEWLEDTLQRLNESSVMVQDRDEDCQGISPANICCIPEHTINLADDERLNKLKKLENGQEELRDDFYSRFGGIKGDHESKLKALESRLKKLEDLEDLEKKKQEAPAAGDTNPIKSKFDSLEQAVKGVASELKQEQQRWAEVKKDNDAVQRRLWYMIMDLKLSLERDKKQIAELQAQFEGLRNHTRNKLENRDTLMG